MDKEVRAWGRIWPWRMVTLAGWLCAGAGSGWFGCTSAWGEPPAKPGGSFLIPACAYDRSVDIVTCIAASVARCLTATAAFLPTDGPHPSSPRWRAEA